MATITFNGESFAVDHAVKGADYIHGYDANGVLIVAFDGVTDFAGFTYDDTYMEPGECLTEHCNTVVYCGGALKTLGGKSVNPSMLYDEEYLTAERWNGKPVYRKIVTHSHTGAIGNSGGYKEVLIQHGISGFDRLIRCHGGVLWDESTGTFPYVSDGGGITTVTGVDGDAIWLKFYKDVFNDPTFFFDLSYTKESGQTPDEDGNTDMDGDGTGGTGGTGGGAGGGVTEEYVQQYVADAQSAFLDTTLSETGKAADAGAVGEYFTQAMMTISAELASKQPKGNYVQTVNGQTPDESGNVSVASVQPTAIDLSQFESNGRIVETFADGTTKTTTVEFDGNGKPAKITDSAGNIMTLNW